MNSATLPEKRLTHDSLEPLRLMRSGRIDNVTGSLEPGKNADVVIWTADPFSVYSRAERVFIDGALMYDRTDPNKQPRRDFETGLIPTGGAR